MQDVPLPGTSAIENLAAASAVSGLGVCIALTFNFPGKAAARDAAFKLIQCVIQQTPDLSKIG
jgi:hypothetical protein